MCILIAALGSGCFAFDEIDASVKKAEKHRPGAQEEVESRADVSRFSAPSATRGGSDPWWGKARSLSSRDLDSGIVPCGLPGGTQFMRKDDCLSRGGKPGQ
jgi:hypothetical protein